MTLNLPCRIRLTLALLLIALMAATASIGSVHWPHAPAPAEEREPGKAVPEADPAPPPVS